MTTLREYAPVVVLVLLALLAVVEAAPLVLALVACVVLPLSTSVHVDMEVRRVRSRRA